jgi:hypothetical protein
MKSIVFETGAKEFILKSLNKSVDSDGFIIDNSNHKKVPSLDGTNFTLEEFAGVVKGSEIYVKSDIVSLIEAVDRIKVEA